MAKSREEGKRHPVSTPLRSKFLKYHEVSLNQGNRDFISPHPYPLPLPPAGVDGNSEGNFVLAGDRAVPLERTIDKVR
jgi:hypothetical protein